MTLAPLAIRRLRSCGVLFVALAAVWGCGGGTAPTATPVPTHSGPAISPVASGTVIDFARAERLYYEGDFEGALAIYSAAVENGDDGERRTGLWEIARIQADRGESAAAERNLELLREMSPDAETDRRALLLLGSVEFAQGDLDEARDAFEAYLDTKGPAASYAHLGLADVESADDDTDAALERIVEALASGLPAGAEADALFTLAALYEAKDDYDRAADTLRSITAAASDANASEALWRRGNLEAGRGDDAAAQAAYRTLIWSYPSSARALDALNTSQAAADPFLRTFDRAFVYFVQRINGLAQTAFQNILASPATGTVAAAEAHYYLGILSERFSLYDDALAHYDGAIALLSPGLDDPLRGQATWDRATVLELQGDINGAIAGFAAVANEPGATLAGEGTFRAGLLAYNLGRVDEAITHWTRFSQVAASAGERARARYWLGLAHRGFDTQQAQDEFAAAAAADPLGYYGLVASGRIDPDFCCQDGNAPGTSSDVERWLEATAGPETGTNRSSALFAGDQWQRAVELHEAGFSERADDEFRGMLEDITADSWLLYRFAEETSSLGLPWISTLAAQRLALRYDGPPPALLRLVYPREYWELVQAEAEAYGFDPYLMLSMMRQESLYFPRAVSPAEALGLTQVIPPTADGIATALEEDDFTYLDLFRPNVSIRFGAYYIGTQLDGFGGNLRAAVAAYNGGPFNAGSWLEAAGGDNDVFVETITFSETRSYVELVLENYALYRYAWGDTSRPALSP